MIFLFSCMNFKFACYILIHFSKCLYVDFFFLLKIRFSSLNATVM